MEKREINKNKICFIDIETDFKRKLLSLGITDYNNSFSKEFYIWQDESKLYYPEDVDKQYLRVLKLWREQIKNGNSTKIINVVNELVELSEKDFCFIGWNIKSFDLNILKKYAEKYKEIDWQPVYFDMYLELKRFYKENPKTKRPENLKANTIWQWLSQTHLKEEHLALSDAELERHIFKLLNSKYKKKLMPFLISA